MLKNWFSTLCGILLLCIHALCIDWISRTIYLGHLWLFSIFYLFNFNTSVLCDWSLLSHSLLDSLEYADQSRYINEFLQLKKFCLHYQRWLGGKFHVQQVVHMLCELSKLYITYRVYHIELVKTKWLWGVEGSIILLNYGA